MLIMFLIVIDCIWKSFVTDTWVGSCIVSSLVMFQVLVLHYQVKMFFELALNTRPQTHTTITFGGFISIHA